MTRLQVPPEHIVSKLQRQELQRIFELGQRILANEPEQAVEAARRFQYCVENDPKNRIYVEAFLQALTVALPTEPRRPFWPNKVSRQWKQAIRADNPQEILRHGPAKLSQNPWHGQTLLSIAQACAAFGYLEPALRYLKNGLDNPVEADRIDATQIDVAREYARTLGWTGRFRVASEAWRRVLSLAPNDSEAQSHIRLFNIAPTEETPEQDDLPVDIDACLDLAQERAATRHFVEAQHLLAHANSIRPGNLQVQFVAEDVQLGQAMDRVEIAERLNAHAPCPATEDLVVDYAANKSRVALEVYNSRAQRFPEESRWKLELGRTLQELKKSDQAADVLSGIGDDAMEAVEARLREGECRQVMRDFAGALECYDRAKGQVSDQTTRELVEQLKRRHDRLAAAMKPNR